MLAMTQKMKRNHKNGDTFSSDPKVYEILNFTTDGIGMVGRAEKFHEMCLNTGAQKYVIGKSQANPYGRSLGSYSGDGRRTLTSNLEMAFSRVLVKHP